MPSSSNYNTTHTEIAGGVAGSGGGGERIPATVARSAGAGDGGRGGGGGGSTVKLYEAIIFSGPIVFTLILLFFFYFFYLRRHSVDWSSLRMRLPHSSTQLSEVGLKKEFREMLPIIIYKESFSVRDTQCSVCLGDYQAEDKLQQIPACGHTFHLNCIDNWLATHTTCPLCRLSLISPSKSKAPSADTITQTSSRFDGVQNVDDMLMQNRL